MGDDQSGARKPRKLIRQAHLRAKAQIPARPKKKMVSGRPLLGEQPAGALRVWQCHLEDPFDELKRKVEAAALHHRVDPETLRADFFSIQVATGGL
jgi:hypothetical protein